MLNKQRCISIILMFTVILLSSIYIEKSEALKCLVCQNCTNLTIKSQFTIRSGCKYCQKIVKLKNGHLNATQRDCLMDKCTNENKSGSPWFNMTTCCTKKDLCNESNRISPSSSSLFGMNIQFIWLLFSVWIWSNY
ncbi:unnamed protein product [Schistosoma turkestanicum]|nr:unnamed protein product [Schistosoma turkestanicum]